MAAAVVGAAFLMLALLLPEGLGLGDVKFVPTLGLALGWLSWGTVVVGMLAAFLLGGLAAVGALLLLRRGRRARLPFGPWLATGALLGVLAGGRLAAWYGHALLGG
jgi:leader peptidase (prepilin peptidase)/N-methyltransferase